MESDAKRRCWWEREFSEGRLLGSLNFRKRGKTVLNWICGKRRGNLVEETWSFKGTLFMKLQTLEVQGLIYWDSEMSRNVADGKQSRLNGQWRWKIELQTIKIEDRESYLEPRLLDLQQATKD